MSIQYPMERNLCNRIVPQLKINPSITHTTEMAITQISMNVYDTDIDLSNTDDKKMYLGATTPNLDDVKFDLITAKFHIFISTFTEKVDDYVLNRSGALTVEVTDGKGNTEAKNLLDCYGDITAEEFEQQATEIWMDKTDSANVITRQNQETLRCHMAYLIMSNLLTSEARKQLAIKEKTSSLDNTEMQHAS